jgi:hypothetical protein
MASQYLVPILIANGLGVVFVILALFKPNLARWIAGVAFVAAGVVDAVIAVRDPLLWVRVLGPNAWGVYKDLVNSVLAQVPTRLELTIAAWQLLVGGLILSKSRPYIRLGCGAAAWFLVMIAPLGIYSAFPSSLIVAAGMLVLVVRKWQFPETVSTSKARATM